MAKLQKNHVRPVVMSKPTRSPCGQHTALNIADIYSTGTISAKPAVEVCQKARKSIR